MAEAIRNIWKSNQMRSTIISMKNSSIFQNKAQRYNSRSISKDTDIEVSNQKKISKLTQKIRRKSPIQQHNQFFRMSNIKQNIKEKSIKSIIDSSMKQLKLAENFIKAKQKQQNLTKQNFLKLILKIRVVVQQIDYMVKHFDEKIALMTKNSINQINIFSERILKNGKDSQLLNVPVFKKNHELSSLETSLFSSQQLKINQDSPNQVTFHIQDQLKFAHKQEKKVKGSFDSIKKKTMRLYEDSKIAESKIVEKFPLANLKNKNETKNQNEKSRLNLLRKTNTITSLFSQDLKQTQSRVVMEGNIQNRSQDKSVQKRIKKLDKKISSLKILIKPGENK